MNLSPAIYALLYHGLAPQDRATLVDLVTHLKNFKIHLKGPRPLVEAISSAGGVALNELNSDLMFQRYPGVFAAGEMLDWDAPTGGFLIQGCVSQGWRAGHGILRYIN